LSTAFLGAPPLFLLVDVIMTNSFIVIIIFVFIIFVFIILFISTRMPSFFYAMPPA